VKIRETKRLLLAYAGLGDAPFILQLLNSPSWLKFIGDKGVTDLTAAEGYVQSSLIKSYQNHGFGLYKVIEKESGVPIGLCGLLKRDYLENPDLGFALLPEYEGKGYGFESAQSILDQAVDTWGFTKIDAITSTDNVKSQRLLQKLSFQPQGSIKDPKGQLVNLFRWISSY